jgi:hypothetical protein
MSTKSCDYPSGVSGSASPCGFHFAMRALRGFARLGCASSEIFADSGLLLRAYLLLLTVPMLDSVFMATAAHDSHRCSRRACSKCRAMEAL